jgi:hypothetical protein
MSLDSIVTVNISIASGGLTGPDYGTALALCNLSSAVEVLWGPDLVRTYTSAAAMLAATEGFTSADSAYKIASAYFSQNPKPAQIKIGRRTHKSTQIVTLTPTNTTAGFIYTGTANGTAWTYTVLAADDTAAKVATKLVTAITAAAPTGVTAADTTDDLTLTSTAGLVVEHTGFSTGLTVEDSTVAPDVAADLAAITAVDDSWYFLLADAFGKDEITDLSTYVEATRKVGVFQTADSAVKTSSTTDIAYGLKAASSFRSSLWYHKDMSFKTAPAMVGNRSTVIPGTDTWFGKTLVGPAPSDELTATEIGYLRGKNCNYLQTIGVSRTLGGWVSGGEYVDNVRGIDALRSDMQLAIASAMFSASKIPNTTAGRFIIKGAIETTLKNYTATDSQPQLLSPDVAQTIYMPPVTDTTSFSAVTRTLSGITWSAGLANAIHAVTVTGTVSE